MDERVAAERPQMYEISQKVARSNGDHMATKVASIMEGVSHWISLGNWRRELEEESESKI